MGLVIQQARDYFRAYRARKKDEREAFREEGGEGHPEEGFRKRSSYESETFVGEKQLGITARMD